MTGVLIKEKSENIQRRMPHEERQTGKNVLLRCRQRLEMIYLQAKKC